MYDPVEKAKAIEKVVCQDSRKKYHRFRAARFYGGIATADCIGCCLGCVFCWSWNQVTHPNRYGRFYSPEEVAAKLTSIARKKDYEQVRISGGEPTLCHEHLLEVIQHIPDDLQFILETNGILLGHNVSYVQDLAAFPNLYVRVSLKGASEEEFSRLTGADPEAFNLQLKALENLQNFSVTAHPAVMVSFSTEQSLALLRKRLKKIAMPFADFEVEELILYGNTAQRLQEAGIEYHRAHTPSKLPPEQI